MKIGVDARSLSSPITGIGRYAGNLLKEMILSDKHEWFVYSSRTIPANDWLKSANVTVRSVNISNRWLRMLWYQTVLPVLVIRDGCNLFWSPAHILPSFLPKFLLRVVTIHDLTWRHAPETMRPLSRFFESWLMPGSVKSSDLVIADSRSTANDLINEIPDAMNKVSVVHLAAGIPVSKNIEAGDYILFVGTLEPRKNLPRLFEAYSRLSPELRHQFPLKVAGGLGWGGEISIPPEVEILGYVSDIELDQLYCGASLLLMPSIYEGFGLPIVEAMSRGVPVLTSDTSSMPEVAGEAAVYVNPYSVESILSGMDRVLTSPELQDNLSKQGLRRSKMFSWSKAANEVLNLFELLESK